MQNRPRDGTKSEPFETFALVGANHNKIDILPCRSFEECTFAISPTRNEFRCEMVDGQGAADTFRQFRFSVFLLVRRLDMHNDHGQVADRLQRIGCFSFMVPRV